MTTPTATIYLDNHSTTRVDPRVVETMLPFWSDSYGNAGSTHALGQSALASVNDARTAIATRLGARAAEVIFTSGATESNNLALTGAVYRRQARGKHIISAVSEHHAIIDPLRRLERNGFEVTWLPVKQDAQHAGRIDLDQLASAIRDDTALVTIMLANNEIGVLQPLAEISKICREQDVLLHTDATQAVGRIPVDVTELGVDMLSFSGHKMYGPKGVGGLYVRRRLRLVPLLEGGGQERGMRSGTLAVPLIVGLARALELCHDELANNAETERLGGLRDRLYAGLRKTISDCVLNGPSWDPATPHDTIRLHNNLNLQFGKLDGESLMINAAELAMSSGSACTSANPEPSHVLKALGLDDDQVRSSLRFGVGRFSNEAEIDRAVEVLAAAAERLRQFS